LVTTVIGIAATKTSETELQISSNEREIVTDFYDAEGAMIDKAERPEAWMTGDFLVAGETSAFDVDPDVDIDSDGASDALVEIRCIEDSGTPVSELSAGANNLPAQLHKAPPPPGSKYSLKHFEVRRYGVTSTSANGNTQIQTGVWRVFNKS
jgi:hypothetical protein